MNKFSLYERLRNAVFDWHRTEPNVKKVGVLPLPPRSLVKRKKKVKKTKRCLSSADLIEESRSLAFESALEAVRPEHRTLFSLRQQQAKMDHDLNKLF